MFVRVSLFHLLISQYYLVQLPYHICVSIPGVYVRYLSKEGSVGLTLARRIIFAVMLSIADLHVISSLFYGSWQRWGALTFLNLTTHAFSSIERADRRARCNALRQLDCLAEFKAVRDVIDNCFILHCPSS